MYYSTGGACYLSFSGGKDSTVVLRLIKLCEEDGSIRKNSIPAVFCDTKLELDATLEFVKWIKDNYYSNVEIIETPKPFGKVIKEFGKPAISKLKSKELEALRRQKENGTANTYHTYDRLLGVNYGTGTYCKIKLANKHIHFLHEDFDIDISNECCHQMKKIPFELYAADHYVQGYFTGERMAEGGARQLMIERRIAKGQSNICTRIKGPYTVKSPIIDWDDETEAAFISKYNVPLSKAYTDYGLTRTGCYVCPFNPQLEKDMRLLYTREPKKYKGALGFLKDVYIAQGLRFDFDPEYMEEFNATWSKYEAMRYEMLKRYRPDCRLAKKYEKDHDKEPGV